MKNVVFDRYVNDFKLNILYSGYCRCNPDWRIRNCASPFCRLYIVEQGGGILQTENETIEMQPGTVYLLPPELPVSHSCPSYMVKLFFHLELLSPGHSDIFLGHRGILRMPVEHSLLAECIALYESQSYYSCLKLKQYLYSLLLQLYQQLPLFAAQMPFYSAHVLDTIRYIHHHLSAQLTVAELAKRRYVSHTTLNRLFRAELGKTVGKYIDDQLIKQARALLCNTTLSIADISSRLSFSDQFYFSKKFKAASGLTPLQYRKTHTVLSSNRNIPVDD